MSLPEHTIASQLLGCLAFNTPDANAAADDARGTRTRRLLLSVVKEPCATEIPNFYRIEIRVAVTEADKDRPLQTLIAFLSPERPLATQ